MAMIEVNNLRYSFKSDAIPAVDGVGFSVQKGEIFGLLGPNGAGKSTTVNILVTLMKPGAGAVRINNHDLNLEQTQIRKMIGVVFQDTSLDERLTAYENLYFHAKLYHVPPRDIKERIAKALHLVNLWERRDELVMKFSGGMKRRLEIARGIIHGPEVLFLDEPTIGLDPQSRRQIWEYVLKMRQEQGLTVFLTTHYMEEAEICDQIAIIDQGKIIALDTPNHLKKQLGGDIIILRTENNEQVRQIIQNGFMVQVSLEADELRIQVANGTSFLPRLYDTIGDKITAIDIKKPTLEDVFIKLTGREIRNGGAGETEKLKNTVKSRWIR